MECAGDPRDLGALDVQSAKYVMSGGGFNNEFILSYASPSSAVRALAGLRAKFAACHRQQKGQPFLLPKLGYVNVAPKGPIDDMFEGEGSTTAQDGRRRGLTPGHYQVYAAREGNVIVVVESYGGWGDRTSVALATMLDKALGSKHWADPQNPTVIRN